MTFLLWISVILVRHPLTSSSQELLGQSLVCSICRVRRQEIVNFMTPVPRGGNFGVKSVKLILKKSSSPLPGIVQTKLIYSNDDQGRVYFHDPGAGVLVLGRE